MASDPGANLAAAVELLATLSAGRSALLQLAGTHLPFDRVLALHRLLPTPDAAAAPWEGASLLRERLAREVGGRDVFIGRPAPPSEPQHRPESRPRRAAPGEVTEPTPRAQRHRRHADVAPQAPPVDITPVVPPIEARAEVAEVPVVQPEPAEPVFSEAEHVDPLVEIHEPTGEPLFEAQSNDLAVEFDVTLEPEPEPSTDSAPVATVLAAVALAERVPPPVEEATSQASAEPPTHEVEDHPAAVDAAGPLFVDVGDEVRFSGSGENTANWGTRAEVSIGDLLTSAPAPEDQTYITPAPISSTHELSDWAASVLGTPEAPRVPAPEPDVAIAPIENTSEFLPEAAITPLASEPTSGELEAPKLTLPALHEVEPEDDRPMLREPRVLGASVATLDVRAAARGVAPRVAGADDIEVSAGEAEDNVVGLDASSEDDGPGGFQVTFEQNVSVRTRARAPRLTDDDDSGEQTNPAMSLAGSGPSIVIDDKRVQALMEEALAYAKKGDLAKAIQAYTDALDMRPTLTDAHIGRGRCHLELGDYSSAMSDFARAEDLAPDKPESHVATGDLYFARKEYKRAIEFYDQAVEIDGSHAMARCRRGISHYYRKNYRQAYQDLQRALALDPEIANIKKYVQMAQKKLERGE